MKSAERRALFLLFALSIPYIAQACQALDTPQPSMTPYPTPAAWATPGGRETAIAEINVHSTERALDAENEKDKNATPRPGMMERDNVSQCVDNKSIEACFTPLPVTELGLYAGNWIDFLNANRGNGQVSSNSADVITLGLQTVTAEIQNTIAGQPDSIEIEYLNSLFPEADGGTTRVGPTRPTFFRSEPPKVEFFLPQATFGNPSQNSQNGTRIHELLHGAWRIESFRKSGYFNIADMDTSQEELNAEFYGNVAQIFLAKTLGMEQNPQFREKVENEMEDFGSHFPFISWFLDQKGIRPENPLWRILYTTHFFYSAQSGYLKYGDQYDLDLMNEYRENWNAYPWTDQEKALLLEMFQSGVEQGYMKQWAYPDFP